MISPALPFAGTSRNSAFVGVGSTLLDIDPLNTAEGPDTFWPWPIYPPEAKRQVNDSDTRYVRNVPSKAGEDIRADRFVTLDALYHGHNSRAVREYLAKHRVLQSVLVEAHEYLRRCFGPNLHVELCLRPDPEVEGLDVLFGYISTDLPVEEALERLERFDEMWFLDAMPDIPARLNFNLRFV